MINEAYKAMLGGKSVIRELSEYATARGAEIGYENVFDYSLGNPSVPCPQSFTDEMIALYQEAEPVALHGYSPSLGITSVRTAIAESLNRRFDMDYTTDYIFPTTGAAGALAHALRVVTKPETKSSPLPLLPGIPAVCQRNRRTSDRGAGRHRKLPNQLRSVRTGAEPGNRGGAHQYAEQSFRSRLFRRNADPTG